MKIITLHLRFLLLALVFAVAPAATHAQTTTTNPDGSTTTTVEETHVEEAPEGSSTDAGGNLIGPTGVTGTIRRSDRRQDRRLEEDLEDLDDFRDETGRGRRR